MIGKGKGTKDDGKQQGVGGGQAQRLERFSQKKKREEEIGNIKRVNPWGPLVKERGLRTIRGDESELGKRKGMLVRILEATKENEL